MRKKWKWENLDEPNIGTPRTKTSTLNLGNKLGQTYLQVRMS